MPCGLLRTGRSLPAARARFERRPPWPLGHGVHHETSLAYGIDRLLHHPLFRRRPGGARVRTEPAAVRHPAHLLRSSHGHRKRPVRFLRGVFVRVGREQRVLIFRSEHHLSLMREDARVDYDARISHRRMTPSALCALLSWFCSTISQS